MGKRPKAKTGDGTRKALARRLLNCRIKHAKVFTEMDSIKASLIDIVSKDGEGTAREVFPGLGQITIAPAKVKEFRGELPEVDPTAFAALSDARRQKAPRGRPDPSCPKMEQGVSGKRHDQGFLLSAIASDNACSRPLRPRV
jgi:hypothetical protein